MAVHGRPHTTAPGLRARSQPSILSYFATDVTAVHIGQARPRSTTAVGSHRVVTALSPCQMRFLTTELTDGGVLRLVVGQPHMALRVTRWLPQDNFLVEVNSLKH